MAALIALAAICLSAAGVVAAIIGMVAVAIRREDRNLTLTSEAPDTVTRVGRWLTGLYVRAPSRSATGDREKALV
jgi:nitrate reductase gamma subunit